MSENKPIGRDWELYYIDPEEDDGSVMYYKYGMRLRGFSPGCQPMGGLSRVEDDTDGTYHDILIYDRKLTNCEVDDYELDYLGAREWLFKQ